MAIPSVQAQTPAAPPAACRSAEYRQFDFWIGTWNVFLPGGQMAGENRVEAIHDGCALLESWRGRGGTTGNSLNSYDRSDKQWHQTWVDNSGTLLMISGGLVGRSMVLASAPAGNEASPALMQRITWTPNDDGSVRQLWESSSDAGQTWTVQFDGRYVRRR